MIECKILGCTGLVSACTYTQVIREKEKKDTRQQKRSEMCKSHVVVWVVVLLVLDCHCRDGDRGAQPVEGWPLSLFTTFRNGTPATCHSGEIATLRPQFGAFILPRPSDPIVPTLSLSSVDRPLAVTRAPPPFSVEECTILVLPLLYTSLLLPPRSKMVVFPVFNGVHMLQCAG